MDENDILLLNEFIEMVDGYGLKPKDLIEFIKWVRIRHAVTTKER